MLKNQRRKATSRDTMNAELRAAAQRTRWSEGLRRVEESRAWREV